MATERYGHDAPEPTPRPTQPPPKPEDAKVFPDPPELVLRAADGRALDEAFNVDNAIIPLLVEDEHSRPFLHLYELKLQDGRHWVSPEVSLRMLVYLESQIANERSKSD